MHPHRVGHQRWLTAHHATCAAYLGNVTHCSRKIRMKALLRLVKGECGRASCLCPQPCAAMDSIMASRPSKQGLNDRVAAPQSTAAEPAIKTGTVTRWTRKLVRVACVCGYSFHCVRNKCWIAIVYSSGNVYNVIILA